MTRVWNPNTQHPVGFRGVIHSLLIDPASHVLDIESLAPYESAQGPGLVVALHSGRRLVVTVAEDDGTAARQTSREPVDLLVVWTEYLTPNGSPTADNFEPFRAEEYESPGAMRAAAIARYNELRNAESTHNANLVEVVRSTDYNAREATT